jgi:predicted DsbA family dithiol-disulfide isomerase
MRPKMRSLYPACIVSILILCGFIPGTLLWGKDRKAPGGKQLASVDGIAITETQARMDGAEELESLELQKLRSKASFAQNEHQILEQAMERLVEEQLIKAEAAKRGITEEELLAKELPLNSSEATSDEIDNFYTANKQRINKPKEEVAPQIGIYLKQQKENDAREAFLKKLENEHKVIRLLQPLRFNVNASERPSLGPAAAPVVLVLFSDYQCPYCKRFSGTLKEVRKQYGDRIRIVFRQFPLTSIHPNAQRAAEAALCAAAQNRFEEMHDSLLQNQNALQEGNLKSRADKLGLDTNAFNACLASARNAALIHEDLRAAASAGVEGTPALFINGRYLNGAQPFEEIAAIIDEELKNRK